VFVVKPAKGSLGAAITPAKGATRAFLAASIMLQRGLDDTAVIEPLMRDEVRGGPGGGRGGARGGLVRLCAAARCSELR
jgi:hypothetical protein